MTSDDPPTEVLVQMDKRLAKIEGFLGTSTAEGSSTPPAPPVATSAAGSPPSVDEHNNVDERGIPKHIRETVEVVYRSAGLGIWGAALRYVGMPLEKIAIISNSSQVSGKSQLAQAVKITFADGYLAPFKVVGRASIVAWFLQYSVMGFVFQSCDRTMSELLGVDTMVYGDELFLPKKEAHPDSGSTVYVAKQSAKILAAPLAAGMIESAVSNRAEVQRFYGIEKMTKIEAKLAWNPIFKQCGPAYFANASRNFIMSSTSFVITPTLFTTLLPEEQRTHTNLFWFGLGTNIFGGNVVAITQQALWGRVLDYGAMNGGQKINYRKVVKESFASEGRAAFFTAEKWFARVLMNAPAQGTIPWFYNKILPIGEKPVMSMVALACHPKK